MDIDFISLVAKVSSQVADPEELLKLTRVRLEANAEDAIKEAANILLDHSLKLVPVDTGALKSTGRVTEFGSGFNYEAAVGYGDRDNTPVMIMVYKRDRDMIKYPHEYAVPVHERTDQKHASPTSSNFLRGPASDGSTAWTEMQEAIKRIMGRGF